MVQRGGLQVVFDMIPWIGVMSTSASEEIVQLCDVGLDASSPADEVKRVLRLVTLRWHPDKFSQTFGPHLHPDHQDRILDRVNAITSGVNWLRKSMS